VSIIKTTEIDVIAFNVTGEIADQGNITIKWAKLTFDDSRPRSSVNPIREVHTATVTPGEDLAAVIASNNKSLTDQGFGEMPSMDHDIVSFLSATVVTPEIKGAFDERKEWLRHRDAVEQELRNKETADKLVAVTAAAKASDDARKQEIADAVAAALAERAIKRG